MSQIRVFVLFTMFGFVLSDGYWDIQLSPQSIASVPFGTGHISVWQYANDRDRYYAMPLVYLLNQSARVATNILTEVTEMSFDVVLWSEEARESVYLYLKREFNSSIAESQIEMLPMEKIRISWKDNVRPMSQRYRLANNWKSNTHLPPVVTFQFTCETRPLCEDLMNGMKESPHFFNALEMEYVINEQRSSRRSLTVAGRHLVQGRLWTKMTTMTGAGDTRYLNADDLKTLTSESVSNVLGSLVTDSDYVDTGDEVNMNNVLQHVLASQQVSTSSFQPHQWDSVFWEPAWARPDKLTHYLNQVLERDASDSRSFLVNEQASARSAGGGGEASFLGLVDITGSGGTNANSQSRVQKENVLSTLRERHSHVEWTGEQFRVKPIRLYRLNLSTLNTSNNVATANVQVRRYEAVHTIKLRVEENSATQTPILTPQLVESRLLQKLNEKENRLLQKLNEKENRLLQKLNEKETRLLQKLDETKSNMAEQTDNKLQTQLVPVRRKLATLPGWPSGGYCIFKKGSCPSGLSQISAWQTITPFGDITETKYAYFGDSYFKLGASDDKIKIQFYLCCHQ